MEDLLQITLMFDFYSELLTEKQRIFFELYYFYDLSLNEIGEQFDITPQGVRDVLKRTEKVLKDYEAKLRLVEKFLESKKKLKSFFEHVDGMDTLDKDEKEQIKQMVHQLFE